MTGVAALVFVATLTNCSKSDLYDEGVVKQQKEATVIDRYNAAFEKAFGKVGPNVDWGFSSKGALTRALTDYPSKGNLQPTVKFPKDCDASNFLDAVPEGVNKLPENGAGAGSYFIDGTTQSVSTWAGASKIYVTGTVDLSAGDTDPAKPRFAPDYRSEIFLLEGATLKLGRVSAQNFKGTIYIAQGATLETTEHLMINGTSKVYNHGSISVPSLEVNTSSILYNVGTLAAGRVSAESNESRIVNDGTISSDEVQVHAGAVQNNDIWTVSGTTKINSNNSGWVNNGHWKTRDYAYIGGSENVINNCFLEVTNNFEMNISSVKGAFKIDTGGGVLTNNFYGGRDSSTGAVSGPFKIVMGQNAVFVVEKTAQFESGRGSIGDNYEYGIFGPSTGGYAVFQAKNIVRDTYLESIKSWGAVTYGGHLYVSAETHFAQGNDGMDAHKFIFEQDGFSIDNNIYAAGFKSGKPNINIPKTTCSPGFKGGNPLYRVIAEDLSAADAGDFDFNDVVFDVVKYEGGKTTLRLQACGGTLPLKIGSTNGVGGIEVHSIYGDNTPDATTGLYKMWNTSPSLNSHAPEDFTINGEYITPEQLLNLRIEVEKDGTWMLLTATKGVAACKILVDDRFPIVPERTSIANAQGNFTTYVQGHWKENDNFWWVQTK